MIEILRKKAFLRINGPSFGWLHAALRSMAQLRSKDYAGDIATPLLVFGAGKDRIVVTETIRASVKNFPNATYIEIEDAEHEILSENDAIRARFWQAFDAFVEARLADGSGGFLNARRGE
jgi:lysophospholipase